MRGLSSCCNWDKFGEVVLRWIKAQLSFAVIRDTDLCLRESSCVRWRSGTGIDDEAGFPAVMPVHFKCLVPIFL